MSDRPKAYSWERVDLGDYLRGVMAGLREGHRSFAALALPHPLPLINNSEGLFLQGFAVTATGAAPDVISVALGTSARAILAETQDADLYHGIMASDELGLGSISVNVSDFWGGVPGSYAIWIRFVTQPGNPGNRAYWSPSTSSEYSGSDNMDDQPIWELMGAAWGGGLPVGWATGQIVAQVTLNAAGTVTATVHHREFYFEGPEDATIPYEPSWGDGANDRNNARDLWGVHDLATFVQFTRRQLQDILGAGDGVGTGVVHPWTDVEPLLPSLYDLRVEHWFSGYAAGKGHHRTIEVRDLAGSARVIFKDIDLVGLDRMIFHGAAYGGDLVGDLLLGTDGGPLVRVYSPAAGNGGITISGPQGAVDADLAVNEEAGIEFGNAMPAGGWGQGLDFKLLSRNLAAGRKFDLRVGPATTVCEWLDVAGNYDQRLRGNYGYIVDHYYSRGIAPSAFLPVYNGGIVGVPVVVQGIDLASIPAAGYWHQILRTVALTNLPEGGWGIDTPASSGDMSSGLLCATHMVASLAWLPNGTILPNLLPTMRVHTEVDAAWKAVNTQRIGVGIVTKDWTTLAVAVVAYADIDLTADAAGVQVSHLWAWTVAAPHTVDHDAYEYMLVVQADDTGGGGGALAGRAGFSGILMPFKLNTYLGH